MDFKFKGPDDNWSENDCNFDEKEPRITVHKYRDFNDTLSQRLFPYSGAYVCPDSYDVPETYLTKRFWSKERERLLEVKELWMENKSRLLQLLDDAPNRVRAVKCIDSVDGMIEMYDWLLSMCWKGDRNFPPMPVDLWKSRRQEAKRIDLVTGQRLRTIGLHKGFMRKKQTCRGTRNGEDISAPKKPRLDESSEYFTAVIAMATSERMKKIVDNMKEVKSRIDDCTAHGVDASAVQTALDKLNTFLCNANGMGEQLAKMQLAKIEKQLVSIERGSKLIRSENSLIMSPAQKRSIRKDSVLDTDLTKSTTSTANERLPTVGKRPAYDSLVDRVKRGQRTRRPARAFTPSVSPDSGRPSSTESSEGDGLLQGKDCTTTLNNRVESAVSSLSVSICSVTETPSIEFMNLNRSIATSTSPHQHKLEVLSTDEQCTKVSSTCSETSLPSHELPIVSNQSTITIPVNPAINISSTTSLHESTNSTLSIKSTFTTPPISINSSTSLVSGSLSTLPQAQFSNQVLMAVLSEKINLCDARISLMSMKTSDGSFQYDFIPVIIESIDKAIEALDQNRLTIFAIHKAAVEAGASQLYSVLYHPPVSLQSTGILNMQCSAKFSNFITSPLIEKEQLPLPKTPPMLSVPSNSNNVENVEPQEDKQGAFKVVKKLDCVSTPQESPIPIIDSFIKNNTLSPLLSVKSLEKLSSIFSDRNGIASPADSIIWLD